MKLKTVQSKTINSHTNIICDMRFALNIINKLAFYVAICFFINNCLLKSMDLLLILIVYITFDEKSTYIRWTTRQPGPTAAQLV
jgi:hypothetical protein